MAKFTADAALAGMTRRAHEILTQQRLVGARGGDTLIKRDPPRVTQPTAMYQQLAQNLRSRSIDALQGLMGRSQGAMQALQVNPFPASRLASMARAAAAGRDQQGLGGVVNQADFERGYRVPGMSGEQLLAIARRQAPTYGSRYVPHNIAQEGQVFTDSNGRRYIQVKFSDPTGRGSNSNEKVYID